MAATAPVIPENTIPVLDHGFVRLDDAMATDLSVVNAARVSFARRKEELDDSDAGLIRFLMRERHGCYDDRTDVLTGEGWKAWPDVTGEERFATLSRTGGLEYQPALRVVHKEFRGHMIGFKGMSLDLLVTPDHRVLAAQTTTRSGRTSPTFRLQPAHGVLGRAHRHVATATWDAPQPSRWRADGTSLATLPLMRLLGLFVGDGHLPAANHVVFNIRKPREIEFLRSACADLGLDLRTWGKALAVPVGAELRGLFAECYRDREKVIPSRVLTLGRRPLEALFEGLIASNGTRIERGAGRAPRDTYVTPSGRLADQVQELALKLGRSATVREHRSTRSVGHFGSKTVWRVTIEAARNTRPGLCRTRADAQEQMGVERYDGTIHCVEVPNGTLYVRRNGTPVWCGNTPFEHNSFRFHVRAPIFVTREWQRHRMSSFNEFSLRYARATDDFYVPEPEDVRTQVGKPGAYSFERVSDELAERTRDEMRGVYDQAYATYERLVEEGVAREVARAVLPVGAYTEFYWTVNARSLMNFVSLRAAETAQREIRRYAEAVERFLAEQMPITHAAFVANDRTAP